MPFFKEPKVSNLRPVSKGPVKEQELKTSVQKPLQKQLQTKTTVGGIPKEAYDETTDSRRANLQYVKLLEETERTRRMNQLEMERREEKLQSKANRALARLGEEEEREWRLTHFGKDYKYGHSALMMEIKKLAGFFQRGGESISNFNQYLTDIKTAKNQSEQDLAYVHIKEEEERARRIALDTYEDEKLPEYRENDFAWTRIKEEEERARRIAEDNYMDELEKDRRLTNKAYTIIEEEKERDRRIAEDDYLKNLEYEYRAENRAWATIAFEEERARLLSFGQFPGVTQPEIEYHRKVFQEVAKTAQFKFRKGWEQPRTQPQGQGANNRHHLNLKKIWVKKEEAHPTKYRPTPSKPTEMATSGVSAPAKRAPTTKPTTAPTVPPPTQETTEKATDRKSMVDQMTDQLFQKLQTKMGLTQMGK